jgi:hypothetical protein
MFAVQTRPIAVHIHSDQLEIIETVRHLSFEWFELTAKISTEFGYTL